ncbi:MAG: AAA family ATPase [Pirellulales bacterium]|nr:AAA family ATPase [Pirellulales bacterium]
MYESYWNIQRKPFEETADAGLYYPSEVHQGALLKIRYAVESYRSAAVLAGASGTGKTLLINLLKTHLPEEFTPLVHLVFPEMPPAELLSLIADRLGASQHAANGPNIESNVGRIESQLQANVENGRHAVLVIDEAHLIANRESAQTLRLLMNIEANGRPAMTQLWVGQPEMLVHLDRRPDLEERLGVKSILRGLTAEETMSYVGHRMAEAGAQHDVFDLSALEALHELSAGIPRRINRLCDLALLIGFAEQRDRITAEQIEAVSGELVAVRPE